MWPFWRRDDNSPAGLGRKGERLAVKALKAQGMKILARNYRCQSAEIDIIALENPCERNHHCQTIVFVEVKTRRSARYTDPQSAVDRTKQRKIRLAAGHYLSTHCAQDFSTRFDIVAIVMPPNHQPRLEHIVEAFV